jgi:hypothetical protein
LDAAAVIYPDLDLETIELCASKLLESYCEQTDWSGELPVPVEIIAEHYLGYDIEIVDDGLFGDPDYLGGILFDRNLIQVSAAVELHEGRYNFTLAHEIGHHVLHRELYLAARAGEPCNILCRANGEKPLIETQADSFAAALLMPSDAVHRTLEVIVLAPVHTFRGLRAMAAKVIQSGGFTNVSNTAMVSRLITLGYASADLYPPSRSGLFGSRFGYRIRRWLPSVVRGMLARLYVRFYRQNS